MVIFWAAQEINIRALSFPHKKYTDMYHAYRSISLKFLPFLVLLKVVSTLQKINFRAGAPLGRFFGEKNQNQNQITSFKIFRINYPHERMNEFYTCI